MLHLCLTVYTQDVYRTLSSPPRPSRNSPVFGRRWTRDDIHHRTVWSFLSSLSPIFTTRHEIRRNGEYHRHLPMYGTVSLFSASAGEGGWSSAHARGVMHTQGDALVENVPAGHRTQSVMKALPGLGADVPAGHGEQPSGLLPPTSSR